MKALAIEDFRRLWTATGISVVGDGLFFIALPFAVIDDLDGSATDVGLVLAFQTLPFAVFVLIAGVWADRLPRRNVMIASDAVRGLVQAVLATLLITGEAELWHLLALCAIYGSADAFTMPALGGLIPSIVPKDLLQQANAMIAVNQRLAMVVGPVLAGVLIVSVGPGGAIAIDAASFFVGVLVLARVTSQPAAGDSESTFWADLKGGVREVMALPWLRTFFPVFSAYHFISLPCVLALGPVLASRELDGAESWAVISTVFGIGAVAGAVLAVRYRPRRPAVAIGISFLFASSQALIIALGGSTAAIAALQALAGIAVSYGFTLWDATLQSQIPAHAISRVTSLDYFASVGTMPLGYALVGPIADQAGLHETMAAASLIVMVMCATALTTRSVRAPT